jgi:hypothetical protein
VEYFMVRFFAVAVVLSCLASSAWAQAQPAPGTPATPAATPAIKKQSPNKAAAKPSVPAANGPCDLALQLPFPRVSESMGNYDSKIVDADSVD